MKSFGDRNIFMLINISESNKKQFKVQDNLPKQFVIIHPFMDGNGGTTRLLTKVILAGMGIDTFNLFSFENYYNRNVTGYFGNLGI